MERSPLTSAPRDLVIDSLHERDCPDILSLQLFFRMRLDEIFATFNKLQSPQHQVISGGKNDTGFLYVPGTRQDRVLLVAHADTVWDDYPDYRCSTGLDGIHRPLPVKSTIHTFTASSSSQAPYWNFSLARFHENGIFKSAIPNLGIGADDRAGLAMLWGQKDSGHSLLVTAGEEKGLLGAINLIKNHPHLAHDIQKHHFMIELDRRGQSDFKAYNVGTPEFRAYVSSTTGFSEPDRESETDICALARDICGANLSVGYYDEHTPRETLHFASWLNSKKIIQNWLSSESLPHFPLPQKP